MFRFAAALILFLGCCGPAAAQTFADDFESTIPPQFPQVNGVFQLPASPLTTRLNWLLGELQTGATTTAAEVTANFDPSWLAVNNVQQTIDFIALVRASHPNARIADLISHTPMRLSAVIDAPGSAPPSGFLGFGTRYAGAGLITQFAVSDFSGSVQFPADQNLTLTEALDKFTTLTTGPSVVVARVGPGGQCTAVDGRNPTVGRATGSVFKTYVLGGVARRVADGSMSSTELIPLVASELAPNGTINTEPLGTPFPAVDLATLMMGISDNTATDLLHERVGRALLDTVVGDYGHANANILRPFLNVSEQFHLVRSFDLATSNSYVNGTEAFQNNFLTTQIVPLGPLVPAGSPFFHVPLLTSGTWNASPMDICAAYSALRRVPAGSEAFKLVDRAMGAAAAQPNVRAQWDRTWYKGGSIGSGAGFHVLVHAWLLEDAGRDPFVVVAMANTDTGGIVGSNVQSVLSRILQLTAALP